MKTDKERSEMTNAEFIVRLRKAKKIAMKLYPDDLCIFDACIRAFDLHKNNWNKDCTFVWPGGNPASSCYWVQGYCDSPADIALVFDNSIADRQREIKKGNP